MVMMRGKGKGKYMQCRLSFPFPLSLIKTSFSALVQDMGKAKTSFSIDYSTTLKLLD
jgi:hypothetical protein